MRILKWFGLALLALIILGVAFNWNNIKRLSTVNSLFDEDKIVEVKGIATGEYPNAVSAALQHVGKELGSPQDDIDGAECKIYMYISQKRILGLLVAEPVETRQHLVFLSCTVSPTDENSKAVTRNNSMILGVKKIWTQSNSRRTGIASQLCDAARKSFSFGIIISKCNMAFAQPTKAGLSFGLSYCADTTLSDDGKVGKAQILAYS